MTRILVYSLIILASISCDKNLPCEPIDTHLRLNVSAEGIKDTLLINNDTIWISLDIPKFVEDTNSEHNLEVCGSLAGKFIVGISDLTEIDGILETANFDFINDIGQVIIVTDLAYLEFEDSGNISKIRFGIVPKVKGIYLIDFAAFFFEPALSLKRIGTECWRNIFDVSFKLNNHSEDNNFHIVEAGSLPEYLPPNYTLEGFQRSGAFAIVVKE